MTPPEQAIAARLTAIAELKDELRRAASQCLFEVQTETWYGAAGNLFGRAADGIAFLSAHVETLTQQVAELEQNDSGHREMILTSSRLQAMWRERAERAEQENARLTADNEEQIKRLDNGYRTVLVQAELRAIKAEQQRDAAHAALREAVKALEQIANRDEDELKRAATLHYDMCGWAKRGLAAITALQPAPAQETERGR